MHEFKERILKLSSRAVVKNRKQAVAIGINEADDKGYKVPKKNDLK